MRYTHKRGTLLLVAEIPEVISDEALYPPERMAEIAKCSNVRVRLEKYYAWRLLFEGLSEFLGESLDGLDIHKNENGKWVCDKCAFSISHTLGVVAVAVSDDDVGVDVEEIRRHRTGLEKLILSENELSEFYRVDDGEKPEYLIKMWTRKESIFKSFDRPAFHPSEIETEKYNVRTDILTVGKERLALSVCAWDAKNTEFKVVQLKP